MILKFGQLIENLKKCPLCYVNFSINSYRTIFTCSFCSYELFCPLDGFLCEREVPRKFARISIRYRNYEFKNGSIIERHKVLVVSTSKISYRDAKDTTIPEFIADNSFIDGIDLKKIKEYKDKIEKLMLLG